MEAKGWLYKDGVFKLLKSPGIDSKAPDSASLCSLAGRYDNPIPIRFLEPRDCSKIPARYSTPACLKVGPGFESQGKLFAVQQRWGLMLKTPVSSAWVIRNLLKLTFFAVVLFCSISPSLSAYIGNLYPVTEVRKGGRG